VICSPPKQCPACRRNITVSRDAEWLECPRCGKEFSIHHKYVAIFLALSYACGFLLAIPEYPNIPLFIFAGLSCGFLFALLIAGSIFNRVPLELHTRSARTHIDFLRLRPSPGRH
jgi:predicted RNA-binding Zn-ribbon protein involved in translation (DUF1610 family)